MADLILDGVPFSLCLQRFGSGFFLFKRDEDACEDCPAYSDCGKAGEGGCLEYSIDCQFQPAEFRGEKLTPCLNINAIPTEAWTPNSLAGHRFSVASVQEAEAREDTFYIYEHEPLIHYHAEVLEFADGRAHVRCEGTAILDGYTKPPSTVPFQLDCWLPVIKEREDWHKLYP